MGILDLIRNIFNTNKKYPKIITTDLHKTIGEPDQLEVALYYEQEPIVNKKVTIEINGVQYLRSTNEQGIAKLNINLPVGTYDCHVSFNDPDYTYVKTFVKVVINPIVNTSDLSMTEKDGSKFTAVLTDSNNNKVTGKKVIFNVNGIDYERTTNNNGEASLPINLNTGDYKILTKTFDITKENTIHITVKPPEPQPPPTPTPTPTPTPAKLYPYITQQGGGKLGQTNGTRCGPHSLMQCIYRLTGIELSEATLASVCGTSSGGTSHQGLATGLAWFNRQYGYNLKMTWKNKSELSWEEIQQAINNGALFFHLLYRDKWGHYEVIKSVGDSLTILNSLGSYCNYPAYCGYIENRSKATQQSYINGISQKSVCIITR